MVFHVLEQACDLSKSLLVFAGGVYVSSVKLWTGTNCRLHNMFEFY